MIATQSLREQVAWACRILAVEGYADLTLGHVSGDARTRPEHSLTTSRGGFFIEMGAPECHRVRVGGEFDKVGRGRSGAGEERSTGAAPPVWKPVFLEGGFAVVAAAESAGDIDKRCPFGRDAVRITSQTHEEFIEQRLRSDIGFTHGMSGWGLSARLDGRAQWGVA